MQNSSCPIAGSNRPLSVSWSVSSEQQPEAYEIYRDSLSDIYEVTDVAGDGRTGFINKTSATRFGPSVIGRGRSVGQTFTRTPDTIRRSGLDHVSIVINLTHSAGDFDGNTVKSSAASVQFRDLTKPSVSRSEVVDVVNVMAPRHLVPAWLLGRRFHGLTLQGESAGGRLVASHLLTLAEVSDQLTEEEGAAAIEATFVIAERFLGRSSEPTPLQSDAIQRTIRRRAVHVFDSMSSRRKPSVDEVAHAIGVSRSSLYRAFEPMGGVLTYVRHRRLARVYGALRMRSGADVSLDALATQEGFASAAQLSAAFRERFGFSPQDVSPYSPGRFGGPSGGRSGEPSDDLDIAAHDVIIDWLRAGEKA